MIKLNAKESRINSGKFRWSELVFTYDVVYNDEKKMWTSDSITDNFWDGLLKM